MVSGWLAASALDKKEVSTLVLPKKPYSELASKYI